MSMMMLYRVWQQKVIFRFISWRRTHHAWTDGQTCHPQTYTSCINTSRMDQHACTVDGFIRWCDGKCLILSLRRTKYLRIDFRKKKAVTCLFRPGALQGKSRSRNIMLWSFFYYSFHWLSIERIHSRDQNKLWRPCWGPTTALFCVFVCRISLRNDHYILKETRFQFKAVCLVIMVLCLIVGCGTNDSEYGFISSIRQAVTSTCHASTSASLGVWALGLFCW